MADNNYNEGNSLGDNYLYTNPYAEGGVMALKINKTDNCNYLASFSYVVPAGGATLTATPLTGNTSSDLKYYRVEVYDGTKTVANSLLLSAPTAAFVVNTSTLDPTAPWTMFFFGSDGGIVGDVGCSLDYKKSLGVIGVAGGSGDTIPPSSKWNNVSYKMLFVSTDDAAFTGFPTEGVDIADGGIININDYSTVAQLVNTGSYVFKIQMKKIGNQPVASTPTPANNDAYSGFTAGVTYPYALSKTFVDVLATLTIKTDVAGVKSGTMTFAVANEGVKPTVSFTITTDVA